MIISDETIQEMFSQFESLQQMINQSMEKLTSKLLNIQLILQTSSRTQTELVKYNEQRISSKQ